MAQRVTKYRNVKTVVDGIKFDSKLEAARYGLLFLLKNAGKISDLRLQVPYRLEVNGMLVCKYIADFVYIMDGKEVVEDVKGMIAQHSAIKIKLMKAVHGIDIKIVKK